jgi:carboxyl-terminal processing protease
MPRRNLAILFFAAVLAAICYRTPHQRMLAGAMACVERDALEPIGEQYLFEGAMQGMLAEVDEHSMFVPPDELEDFYEEYDLQFGGVGIQPALDPDTRQLKVLSPLVGSPAYRAGILAGDQILRIDGYDTEGMSLTKASELLRGEPDAPVTLVVLHEGAKEPVEIRLIRQIVQVESVAGDTRNADGSWNFLLEGRDRIGYVRITCFTDATVREFKETLERLKARGLRGLVLDLRDNPGGYVEASVDVCKMLIRSGVIVTTRGRSGAARKVYSKVYCADRPEPFVDVPLAVVVNENTASAAEIVAACLQDHRRAKIVGSRTYGKGTVQEVIDLGWDYGAMKFTTASYRRPSDENIQRPRDPKSKAPWGVSPDQGCQVALTSKEFAAWQRWRARRDTFSSVAGLAAVPDQSNPSAPSDSIDKKDLRTFVDRPLRRAVECVEER